MLVLLPTCIYVDCPLHLSSAKSDCNWQRSTFIIVMVVDVHQQMIELVVAMHSSASFHIAWYEFDSCFLFGGTSLVLTANKEFGNVQTMRQACSIVFKHHRFSRRSHFLICPCIHRSCHWADHSFMSTCMHIYIGSSFCHCHWFNPPLHDWSPHAP